MVDEDGFTVIEVLVAAVLLVIGITAMFGVLDVSRRLTGVAERQTSMTHRAQQELERVQAMPFAKVVLAGPPATSVDPANPGYYVRPGSPPTFQWDRQAAGTETLTIDAAVPGGLPATATPWSDGRLSGYTYDFVTWHTDSHCGSGCPATSDYKRVTVAVTLNGSAHPSRPVLASTVMADPNAQPAGFVGPGQNPLQSPSTQCLNAQSVLVACTNGLGTGTANTWFLYDTDAASSATRAPITGDHPTHATVAAVGALCSVSGIGCPKPDLMGSSPPPAPVPLPALYNYSSDISGSAPRGGRTLQRDTGCAGPPSTTDNTKGAFWSTAPLGAAISLTGDGGLTLYTQTAGGAVAPVTLCVAFYDVPGSILNLISAPAVPLGVVAYASVEWPGVPTPVSFSFDFRGASGPVAIAAGHRVGIRLWAAASTGVDIGLFYDHPNYPSQLQLNSR